MGLGGGGLVTLLGLGHRGTTRVTSRGRRLTVPLRRLTVPLLWGGLSVPLRRGRLAVPLGHRRLPIAVRRGGLAVPLLWWGLAVPLGRRRLTVPLLWWGRMLTVSLLWWGLSVALRRRRLTIAALQHRSRGLDGGRGLDRGCRVRSGGPFPRWRWLIHRWVGRLRVVPLAVAIAVHHLWVRLGHLGEASF